VDEDASLRTDLAGIANTYEGKGYAPALRPFSNRRTQPYHVGVSSAEMAETAAGSIEEVSTAETPSQAALEAGFRAASAATTTL